MKIHVGEAGERDDKEHPEVSQSNSSPVQNSGGVTKALSQDLGHLL